jgi:hypothetical protein
LRSGLLHGAAQIGHHRCRCARTILPTFSNRGAASALLLLASGCGGEESKLIQGETADGQSHERNVEPGEELQADQPQGPVKFG